ncbi:hypothetical protein [Aminobacter sp. LjRoot7]|uniref:hypothetical protein n=1 Tax=Aminobacter sp. LjRoot7 TaxID=3342335 RepID=UPI003F502872
MALIFAEDAFVLARLAHSLPPDDMAAFGKQAQQAKCLQGGRSANWRLIANFYRNLTDRLRPRSRMIGWDEIASGR